MTFVITGLYAALLTLVILALSLKVSIHRAKTNISILHGDNMDLAQTIRHHGNIIEYVPMAIILLGICEVQGANTTFLHILGIVLLVSRLIHPFGLRHADVRNIWRGVGHFGTFAMMLVAAGYILWTFLT